MTFVLLVTSLTWLTSCAHRYTQLPSANAGDRSRVLVLHYTAAPFDKSRHALVDKGDVSAHYLVTDPNDITSPGKHSMVYQLVPESKRAWHAGESYWQTRTHINDTAIGIEIVNVPDCQPSPHATSSASSDASLCVYPDYSPEQLEKVIALAQDILSRNPDISPTAVVGHADIAFNRKQDPGPRFPWYQLYLAGVGAWYNNHDLSDFWQQFEQQMPSTELVQAALNAYGYGVIETGMVDEQTQRALRAFQMHFLPTHLTGAPDSQTAAAVFALLKKYFPQQAHTLTLRYKRELEYVSAHHQLTDLHGQIDEQFPQQNRSTRAEVNDKGIFKAYAGRGEIFLQSDVDSTATIAVNGEVLNIASPLLAGHSYHYSLHKRTRNGVNTLSVSDVKSGSALSVRIPWPTLTNNTASWQQRFKAVDALIQQDIDDGFPGAVLLVIKDGEVIKRSAYGYALKYAEDGSPLASPVAMTTSTLFDLASNTKMFATNFAIMKLVSENRLSLNTPVQHYLPEYRGDGREARTIKDLLSHQSGYAPEVRFFDPPPAQHTMRSRNKSHTASLLASQVPLKDSNQLHHQYSDTNFMLLGLIVERVTGMSLDRYCEQFIYGPLHANHTLFTPLAKGMTAAQFAATEIQGNTRSGHVSFSGIRDYTLRGEVHDEKAWYSMGGVSGHAGLFSNVDDMAVFMQLLLNGGGYGDVAMFDAGTLDTFTAPSASDAGFGLGWRRAADGRNRWHFGPYASHLAYGHTGWTGTVTVIDPAYDLAIVLLTNARHAPVNEDTSGNLSFTSSTFETGKYGSVISRIYEAVLNKNP